MKNKEIVIGLGVVVVAIGGMYFYKKRKESKSLSTTTISSGTPVSDNSEKESLLKEIEAYADRQSDAAKTLRARKMYSAFKALLPKMSLQECRDYVRIVLALEKDHTYLTKKVIDAGIYESIGKKYGISFSAGTIAMLRPINIENSGTIKPAAYDAAIASAMANR